MRGGKNFTFARCRSTFQSERGIGRSRNFGSSATSNQLLFRKKMEKKRMNFLQKKIYLYNVTFGLHMLDWWERYLFNILMIVLLWFIFCNGSHAAAEFYKSSWLCSSGKCACLTCIIFVYLNSSGMTVSSSFKHGCF